MASNETAYKASQKYKANIIKRAPLDMQATDFENLSQPLAPPVNLSTVISNVQFTHI